MEKIFSAVTLLGLIAAAPASAAVLTFTVDASNFVGEGFDATTFDPMVIPEPDGMLNGTFDVDDLNSDGFVDANEVSNVNLIASGFSLDEFGVDSRNFSITSAGLSGVIIDNSTNTFEIAPGLRLGLIDFTSTISDNIQIDLQLPQPNYVVALTPIDDPNYGRYTTSNFTINDQNFDVPLPAALPLMVSALGVLFGVAARQRRKVS